MTNEVTFTGENALRIQYLIALARVKVPGFYACTDNEIIEYLIDKASVEEVTA